MKNRVLIPLLSLTTISAATAQERPNILLIMADDMGFECLGANGSTLKTPNLDRLAEQGIRFTNCHAQPLSTPTRVQMMTGLYNNRNYVKFGLLDPAQRTFGNVAKDAGYKTCIAGKWQLGSDSNLPTLFGFDSYCLWQFTQQKSKGGRYVQPLYDVDGKEEPIRGDIDTYGPDVYSDYICDFIEKNSNEPMFIYYPMALIHAPFNPTPDSEEWDITDNRKKSFDPSKLSADMTAYADKMVGKIFDKLKQTDLLDNTLILFIGDNGTHTSVTTLMEDGTMYKGGKRGTHRNGTHVPMIAWWGNNIKSRQVNENIIDTSDFYPTIRDAIGGDASKDRTLDGISFYNQLVGKHSTPRDWSFCHYPAQDQPTKYVRFAQTADYKLYSSGRFYNTRTDADEKNKLTEITPTEQKIRKMLQDALDSFPEGSEIIKGETFNTTN